ncbi:MAG: class II glutamine amidotransferase [Phycisphaerales bacterium]|nr:class II glutamine amidotransferase [Phycisphaerales bacterium]
MCRWIAYIGPQRRLASLIVEPAHSLLVQSRHATQSTFEVNADGFGIGWFRDGCDTPGVFRDTRPAWNDTNLQSITEHLWAPVFLAHIRASTAGDVARNNCHPFRHRNWLFQHNGGIGDFHRIRHELDGDIHPDLYALKGGATDTETMFLLALTYGLQEDPRGGIRRMVERVEQARTDNGIEAPFHMTVAATDGCQLYAARWASDANPPSLWYSTHPQAVSAAAGEAVDPGQATLIVSEPLDDVAEHWAPVEAATFIEASGEGASARPLMES